MQPHHLQVHVRFPMQISIGPSQRWGAPFSSRYARGHVIGLRGIRPPGRRGAERRGRRLRGRPSSAASSGLLGFGRRASHAAGGSGIDAVDAGVEGRTRPRSHGRTSRPRADRTTGRPSVASAIPRHPDTRGPRSCMGTAPRVARPQVVAVTRRGTHVVSACALARKQALSANCERRTARVAGRGRPQRDRGTGDARPAR